MSTFTFNKHKQETEYPESGFRTNLGNSYTFTAPPPAPDQRKFTLHFETLWWYLDGSGATDLTHNATINLGALDAFYQKHKLFGVFVYPHPMFGNLMCSFNKPLKISQGKTNGNGSVDAMTVELIERPGMAETFSP